jgi:hypothetical protein
VVPDRAIIEDLVSPGDIVDSGCVIYQDKFGGVISNPTTGAAIDIHRKGTKWTIWMKDLKEWTGGINASDSSEITVLRSVIISGGVFDRVISLHERTLASI